MTHEEDENMRDKAEFERKAELDSLKQRIAELEACIKSHNIPVKTATGGVAHYCTRETLLDAHARQVENEEVPCNPHPDAPHGFSRGASHSAGRYVCECENWRPDDEG